MQLKKMAASPKTDNHTREAHYNTAERLTPDDGKRQTAILSKNKRGFRSVICGFFAPDIYGRNPSSWRVNSWGIKHLREIPSSGVVYAESDYPPPIARWLVSFSKINGGHNHAY